MDITLYRYKARRANWTKESATIKFAEQLVEALIKLPFYGDNPEQQFGFANCVNWEKIVFGLFIQKFSKKLTDYDPKTKEEIIHDEIDSGKYLFIIDLENHEIFLQNKRSADLPKHEIIVRKFTELLKLALSKTNHIFNKLEITQDIIDREKIISIFYDIADEVTEIECTDFDPGLILEEKKKRGKRQIYFNPKEEYQEAMEEAAIKIASSADKASIKAKEGGNLKKDPISRALLEGAKQPTKIVYKKEKEEFTDSAVTRRKEVVYIEGLEIDLKNEEQVSNILKKLFNNETQINKVKKTKGDDRQKTML